MTTYCVCKYMPDLQVPGNERNRGNYSNPFEVKMLLKLADYLVTVRGYSPNDIGVIAMYQEQKTMLIEARRMYPNIGSLTIATVDGFQGKEKEIILVSLVRSNDVRRPRIGFLEKPNRVCVALSRAKTGLFIFGDMDCLLAAERRARERRGGEVGEHELVWTTLNARLVEGGSIGYGLHLECLEHEPFPDHFVHREKDWAFQFCAECPVMHQNQ